MASNRKPVRTLLASLISTEMVGTGKPVQAVYAYRPADFGGQSPVVTVSSSGSGRKAFTRAGTSARMYFQVGLFVLYTDQGAWGPAQAEDALDDIETLLAGLLAANQVTVSWNAIDYAEARSQRLDVAVGGQEYIFEPVEVAIEVYG